MTLLPTAPAGCSSILCQASRPDRYMYTRVRVRFLADDSKKEREKESEESVFVLSDTWLSIPLICCKVDKQQTATERIRAEESTQFTCLDSNLQRSEQI
jgi:hypothetical protein